MLNIGGCTTITTHQRMMNIWNVRPRKCVLHIKNIVVCLLYSKPVFHVLYISVLL